MITIKPLREWGKIGGLVLLLLSLLYLSLFPYFPAVIPNRNPFYTLCNFLLLTAILVVVPWRPEQLNHGHRPRPLARLLGRADVPCGDQLLHEFRALPGPLPVERMPP